MLSAFARQYGYVYLRDTVVSLVYHMIQVPRHCSFELDSSKLPPGEDTDENVHTLVEVTQAFIDVIVDSVTGIPSYVHVIFPVF
jgi:hypothetical protein